MNENKTNINWYPGHMVKTKKEIAEALSLIDVVYELIDARIPSSSRIKDIDNIVKNKPRIIVMTKADLCDRTETLKWVNKYEEDGNKVILANLNSKEDFKKIIDATNEITKTINEKRIAKGLKEKQVKALVVGIPNVGKSTFINKLAGRNVAGVGNMPGFTKNLTWLRTNQNIVILDTPGILWPKFESAEVALNLAAMSAIRPEVLDIHEVAVHILKKLEKYYPEYLSERYNLNELSEDYEENYGIISQKIGASLKGGEIDYNRVSNFIINDIKLEHIKNITFDRR